MSASNLTRRMVLAGSAMLGTAAVAQALVPRKAERGAATIKIEDLLSNQIGPWKFTTHDGVVQTAEEGQLDGYDQLVTRVYSADNKPTIMFLVAYGSTQGGSLQLHRPETCYPAQGFSIEGIARTTLALDRADPIAAQTFTAVRDTREEHLLYWTRISESFPLTTGEEYRAIFGGVLRGIVPDGVLVRFSTIDADKAQAMAALQEFAGALLAQSPEKLREILVGSVRAREISGTA